MTPQNTIKLYGVVKSDRKLPLQEVTNILNEYRSRPLSDRTVQRNVFETKYHKCVVKQTSGFATTMSRKDWHVVN